MKKRLFISQPMTGRSEDEIFRRRKELTDIAQQMIVEELELVNGYFSDTPDIEFGVDGGLSIYYLGKAVTQLCKADIVIFAEDWSNSAGCIIERDICELYGIPYIERCENGWNFKMVRRWLKEIKPYEHGIHT